LGLARDDGLLDDLADVLSRELLGLRPAGIHQPHEFLEGSGAVVAISDLDPLDNRGELFTRYASGRLVFPVTRLRVGGVGLSGFL
jgi:hypothetical protein